MRVTPEPTQTTPTAPAGNGTTTATGPPRIVLGAGGRAGRREEREADAGAAPRTVASSETKILPKSIPMGIFQLLLSYRETPFSLCTLADVTAIRTAQFAELNAASNPGGGCNGRSL
jgi:hypothetical protein